MRWILLLASAAVTTVAVARLFLSRQLPAGEAERRRRRLLHRIGRMTDGMITDVRDNVIFYTYSIGRVSYTASQDVSELRDALGEDLSLLVGLATIKYSVRNPADSIVVCEEWSGIGR